MSNQVVAVSLLKRIAEAVDGYRNIDNVWVSAKLDFPHELEIFESEAEAEDHAQKYNYETFGPYTARRNLNSPDEIIEEVVEIKITLKRGDKIEEIKLDSKNTDAVFLSESAVDKFVMPYYTQLYGVEYAATLKSESSKKGIISCHIRTTKWTPPSTGND